MSDGAKPRRLMNTSALLAAREAARERVARAPGRCLRPSRASRSGASTMAGSRARGSARACEHQAPVAAVARVRERLERRRGRAEHDGDAARMRAPHRDVARVVAHAVLLLVRAVVLLVDDDEREVGQRREHGEPRAEHEPRVAARARRASAAGARLRARPLCSVATWRAGQRGAHARLELPG